MSSEYDCDLLVLGASFTGIELMYQLGRRGLMQRIDTIVVDRRAEHGYVPLIHELAVADQDDQHKYSLSTAAFLASLPRCQAVCDDVVGMSPELRAVELASGRRIRARLIVVALGSQVAAPPSLTGAAQALGLKFAEQGGRLRRRLAELTQRGPKAGSRILVVGGGISGVESAGELCHWSQTAGLGIDVTLVHGGPRLLPGLSPRAASICERSLEDQGVDLRLDTRLLSLHAGGARLRQRVQSHRGEQVEELELACDLTLWAGGVRPGPVLGELGLGRTQEGWLRVDRYLRCLDGMGKPFPGVFAGGDAVRVEDGGVTWPTMRRAIECLWSAQLLAKNIERVFAAEDGPTDGLALLPHRCRPDFFHGVSAGKTSLVVYGRLAVDLGGLGIWFRRWLMRRYFARYRPR